MKNTMFTELQMTTHLLKTLLIELTVLLSKKLSIILKHPFYDREIFVDQQKKTNKTGYEVHKIGIKKNMQVRNSKFTIANKYTKKKEALVCNN